jgi:GAF domain-containing protein
VLGVADEETSCEVEWERAWPRIRCSTDRHALEGTAQLSEEMSWDIEKLRNCLTGFESRSQKGQCAVQVIRRCRGYRWVGLYHVGTVYISVIAWDGPGAPTYRRFPVTSGLNGAAVASGAPVIVQDVTHDPRYLTTLGSTKAEMVVPVRSVDGRVVGTIDVESDRFNAFTEQDRAFLEACAAAITPLWPSLIE